MKFKDVVLSEASTEAKVAALALLLDKELIKLADTVLNIKKLEGPKGKQGLQGLKGEQGDRGFDGTNGKDGADGKDGKDGEDGKQGVGVADAKIDFDGSLVITLTDGTEINAGDVVPLDTTEKIRVIGNGGGTSQSVLDAIAAIQATIATYGTMALQNDTAVDINGGAIDGTSIGASSASTGTFTTLIGGNGSANYGQLTGGATTKAVEFKTLGSDTNVSFAIRSKGIGAIDLAAGSSGVNISNGGTVTAITRTVSAFNYTSQPTLTISAPTTAGGVQATAVQHMYINTAPVTSGGTGYTVGDVLTVVGGTPVTTAATLTVSAVSAGVITSVTSTNFSLYSVLPSSPLSVTGGTGSGATFSPNWGNGNSFTITNAGSGYVEQPTVSFSGGGGSGAAAYATVGSGTVVRSLGSTLDFYTPNQQIGFRVQDNSGASSTGYWTALGGSTSPILRAIGSGAGRFDTASAVPFSFLTNQASSSAEQFRIAHTASAVNYVQVTGAATGGSPTISAQGSNADIDFTITPKGTNGRVRFGTYTALMGLVTTGYIEVKDSGGTVRRLAVV